MIKTLDLPNGYYELPKGKLANVATCLEMLERPKRPLKSLPSGYKLVSVDPGDLASYRDLFRQVGQDWMWFSRINMPGEELHGILTDPQVKSYALSNESKRLGMLELDFREPGQCELAFFGLARDAIGKGLGRALIDEGISMAWAEPITRLWVHTCTFDSPDALPFYIRSGFTAYTRMVEFHDDPRLTGNLPRTATPQVPIID
jgi:GNAT superfamily N-acetyltransferase